VEIRAIKAAADYQAALQEIKTFLSVSDALAESLLRESRVGVTPGSGFGAPHRICLSHAASIEALPGLKDGCSSKGHRATGGIDGPGW
jgi:aspartate/methionine/tyrosine aminotransferase